MRIFWSSVKLSGSSYEAHCEKLFDNRSMSTLDFCILFCNFLRSFVVDLCNHMCLILSSTSVVMISSQVCFSISFYYDAILFIHSVFTLNIFSLLQILLQNVLTSSIGTSSTIFFLSFTLKTYLGLLYKLYRVWTLFAFQFFWYIVLLYWILCFKFFYNWYHFYRNKLIFRYYFLLFWSPFLHPLVISLRIDISPHNTSINSAIIITIHLFFSTSCSSYHWWLTTSLLKFPQFISILKEGDHCCGLFQFFGILIRSILVLMSLVSEYYGQ